DLVPTERRMNPDHLFRNVDQLHRARHHHADADLDVDVASAQVRHAALLQHDLRDLRALLGRQLNRRAAAGAAARSGLAANLALTLRARLLPLLGRAALLHLISALTL